ncbi:MAG TPA: hypothetical protein DDY59_01645 [Lachnospiraceae bacterium]|nr:hypothetical protein [Lachnospiraceae bacterium]
MLGTYERGRDTYIIPACWNVTNDSCLPHFHSSLEFVYVTNGELKATLNGVHYDVKKGQILIVTSYTIHYYETVDSSEEIILTVPLDYIPSYNKQFSHSSFAQNVYQDTDIQNSEILRSMKVLSKNDAWRKLSTDIVKGYIYVIIGTLIAGIGLTNNNITSNQDTIRDVLIYIQNNYLSQISLQQLAKHFGYSTSRFSHLFNTYLGCTISEYINTLRCRYASGLFLDDSVSIINAAMSSGFSSMRTFYRSFKKCFGVTPSQYRDNYMKICD